MEWLNLLLLDGFNKFVSCLPYAGVHVLGEPVGIYTYKLLLLILSGEVIVLCTKKVKR